MIPLVEFLKINELSQKEIADFLGVQEPYISKICNGYQNLPKKRKEQLLGNSCGWDTTPLKGRIVQTIGSATIGNHSNNNTQIIGEYEALKRENELLKQLLEEKERTIQILLNNGK